MRIAHFIQRYPPALGGSEAYFARLSRWLTDRAHHVTVWTSTAIDLSAFWTGEGQRARPGIQLDHGVCIRRYEPSHWFARRPMLKLLSYLPFPAWQCLTQTCNPIALRMLLDVVREETPCDVVHASALPYGWPLWCARALSRRHRVPFLLTPFLHLGDPDDPRDKTRRIYTSRAMRYLLQSADRLFVQTEVEGEALKLLGIPYDRIVLQGMGVDPSECTGGERDATRRAWGIGPRECVVGHLANLSHAKGTIDLLRAARTSWNQGGQCRLVLAGPSMPDFRRFWSTFEPKDRVILTGSLTEQQKRDFFAGIDAFCLPSRSDSFGLVLLEAWANGKATIAYRAGGVAELLHDGDDGILVRCGDQNALSAALRKVEQDNSLREALGAAGHERIHREFRWEDKLRIVEKVMQSSLTTPNERFDENRYAGTSNSRAPASKS